MHVFCQGADSWWWYGICDLDWLVNTLRCEEYGRFFWILLESFGISFPERNIYWEQNALKFVPKGQITDKSSLDELMACRLSSDYIINILLKVLSSMPYFFITWNWIILMMLPEVVILSGFMSISSVTTLLWLESWILLGSLHKCKHWLFTCTHLTLTGM